MKIIIAGMSRTGIYTLQAALEKFGYHSYNYFEMLNNFENGHLDLWSEFMEGKREMDWESLFEGYDVSSDMPCLVYWREQMEAFPDAKVILTTRDVDAWWESWAAAVDSQEDFIISMGYLPRFAAVRRVVDNFERNFFRIEPTKYVEEDAKARVLEHNEAVKAAVPPERLLVFSVKEGWEPLCNFLGVPVPDEPFPHENAGVAEIERKIGEIVQQDMAKHGPPPQR